MELLDQLLQQASSPIFEKQNGPRGGLFVERALERQVHEDRDHRLQGLVEVVVLVLDHSLEHSQELVLNRHVAEGLLLLNRQGLGFHEADQVGQQVDQERLLRDLAKQLLQLRVR